MINKHQLTIWSFLPLPALNGETGFVLVDYDLAKSLLADGLVQSLTKNSAFELRHIESAANNAPAPSTQSTPKIEQTTAPPDKSVPPATNKRVKYWTDADGKIFSLEY